MHPSLQHHPPPIPSQPLLVTTVFATNDVGVDPFAAIPRRALSEFFDSVRWFVLSEPWDALGTAPLGVDIPELGLVDGCAFMFGERPGPRGIALFRSYEDFEEFQRATARAEHDATALTAEEIGVGFTVLDFFSLHDLCGAAISRVAKDALRLADEDSYAVPEVFDDRGASIPFSKRDLRLLGAVLTTIADTIARHRERLDGTAVVQAIVESPGAPVALVEFPHARWLEAHPAPS